MGRTQYLCWPGAGAERQSHKRQLGDFVGLFSSINEFRWFVTEIRLELGKETFWVPRHTLNAHSSVLPSLCGKWPARF